jgi:hypothetical protein
MVDVSRFPLRASHREALRLACDAHGLAKFARLARTSVPELEAIVNGQVAPTVHDRSAILGVLVRLGCIGRAVGDTSDIHGPGAGRTFEGFEVIDSRTIRDGDTDRVVDRNVHALERAQARAERRARSTVEDRADLYGVSRGN